VRWPAAPRWCRDAAKIDKSVVVLKEETRTSVTHSLYGTLLYSCATPPVPGIGALDSSGDTRVSRTDPAVLSPVGPTRSRQRRRQPRPATLRSRICPPLRRRTDTRLLRHNHPPPLPEIIRCHETARPAAPLNRQTTPTEHGAHQHTQQQIGERKRPSPHGRRQADQTHERSRLA